MNLIRSTLLLCLTALLCVGTVSFSNYKKDRFKVVAVKEGVFVFDRQTSASNFCNTSKCVVLSSEFLIPKKILVTEIPGVITKGQNQSQDPYNSPTESLVNQATSTGQNPRFHQRKNLPLNPENPQANEDLYNRDSQDKGKNIINQD